MKRCPICGHNEFLVTTHVTQEWLVNADGIYIMTTNDYIETTHGADDDDIWTCNQCGHDAPGREFNIESGK